jgi:hypothetical protein
LAASGNKNSRGPRDETAAEAPKTSEPAKGAGGKKMPQHFFLHLSVCLPSVAGGVEENQHTNLIIMKKKENAVAGSLLLETMEARILIL